MEGIIKQIDQQYLVIDKITKDQKQLKEQINSLKELLEKEDENESCIKKTVRKFKELKGKTIINVAIREVHNCEDTGFLELQFSDGTQALIIANKEYDYEDCNVSLSLEKFEDFDFAPVNYL